MIFFLRDRKEKKDKAMLFHSIKSTVTKIKATWNKSFSEVDRLMKIITKLSLMV